MKFLPKLMATALICSTGVAFAQVQINKPIELVGGSGERMLTGLELPLIGVDAANKDYVDAAVAAAGGGSSIPAEISNKSGAQMSYKDAVQYCDALVENTKDDWRLPTFGEIEYFAGSSTDSDFLWTKSKSEYDIATNQNFISVRLNDGSWSSGGIVSRFLPRSEDSGYSTTTGTILTVTPTVGDLMLLPNFRFNGLRTTATPNLGTTNPQHTFIITFADGGTLTLGPYTSSSNTTHYQFTARDMEEAWQFGPIQKIDVQQTATGYQGRAIVYLDAAYEIILTQADSGSGLYARCVR